MIYYIIFLFVSIAVDQVTKFYIIQLFTHELGVGGRGTRIAFIPNVLNLKFAKNTGAAWSILRNNQWFLIILSSVLIIVLLWLFVQGYKDGKNPLLLASLVLVVGGAMGNLIDRLRIGYVVDFFEFDFINFPIFNIADVFICVGMGIIAMLVLFFNIEWP